MVHLYLQNIAGHAVVPGCPLDVSQCLLYVNIIKLNSIYATLTLLFWSFPIILAAFPITKAATRRLGGSDRSASNIQNLEIHYCYFPWTETSGTVAAVVGQYLLARN